MKYETTEYTMEVKTPAHLEQRRFTDIAEGTNWHAIAVTVVYLLIYANMALGFLNACSAMRG